MESLVSFFENIPTIFRAGLLIGGIIIFWVIEGLIPAFYFGYNKFKHAGVNIFFNVSSAIIGISLAWLLLLASDFTTKNQFGLLYIFKLPLWLHVVLGVMLLDLIGAYLIHLIEHKVKWMWKFHLVHHSDTTVDVTTGLRHHPGEIIFRISFTILTVLIAGIPMGIIMLYQSMSVLFAHLTHANIQIPEKIDELISYVLVSPNMHKVHHHDAQPYTDTNYGNIFSIWDRLFGTFSQKPIKSISYGIHSYKYSKETNNVWNLLAVPFKAFRAGETEHVNNLTKAQK